MTEKKSTAGNGLKVLAGLLGVVLLATIIYTATLYQDKKKTTADLLQQKQLVVEDLNSLKSEYDKAILESNATNEELIEARDKIANYIDSVKTMKADIKYLFRYKNQVSQLKKEREVLLARVDSLTTSNALLAMQRDSTFFELERQSVFNDSLVVQNTQLAEAVEKGSALSISDIIVDAVKERNNGSFSSTQRAKAADKIKVCFAVNANTISSSGIKEFYIELLDPQGNLVGNGGSATSENGNTVAYTKTTSFDYQNTTLDICDYVNKPANNFQKGKYMVVLYDDKLNLLGSNGFELK